MASAKLMDAQLLLADDDIPLVKQARLALEPLVGPIVSFTDCTAAFAHLESGEKYEALIVNAGMQPVDGLQIMQMARKNNPWVQVIMLADSDSMTMARRAMQLGAVDFVPKPVHDWEALARSLRRAFGERDLKFERARLVKELMQRNEELTRAVDLLRKTNEISELMHASRNIEEVLNLLLRTANQVLEAERISVMIRDPEHDEMGMHVAQGIDKAVIKEVKVKANEGIAGKVIASGMPIVVADAQQDARVPQSEDKTRRYRGRAFMCIPIFLSGANKVMGVLNITERRTDQPFTEIETEFVQHLARQAAHALMNAALLRRRSQK